MSPRIVWKALFASILLLSMHQSAYAQAKKPNIVIIVGDDMGYHDVGVHGCKDIPTPNIDSIAKNGVRFTNGYVSGPYCSPTRAGLLTGRYQTRFGHEFNPGPTPKEGVGLPLTQTTIAQMLRDLGYATGLVGKWHLGGDAKFVPNERGFQEFFGFHGGAHPYFLNKDKGAPIYRNKEVVKESEYLTDAFRREAVSFIDKHKQEPFFLYLAFNAVHTPMQAADKYLARFPDVKDDGRRKYAAMMSAMDDAIGAVLTKLRDAGIEDNTLIFFISDNGGPTGVNSSNNTPLRGNKTTTWEGGIRVPWLIQWKGRLPGGKTFDSPVIQLDILPTALAALDAAPKTEAKIDGVNLLPFLEGKQTGNPHEALFWRFGKQSAIRMGDYVLVEANGSMGKQLFNLKDDIGQTKDLSAAEPERVQRMQAAWNAWNQDNIPAAWGGQAKKGKKGKED